MQQGGSQYGMSPEMTRTQHILGVSTSDQLQEQQQQQVLHQQRSSDTTAAVVAEGASPISSRAPPVGGRSSGNLDELVAVSSGGFPDDDGIGGDEMERGVLSGGNRWPRQETIALLKIRSEMDAAFRDATLKGPLWDDVSRKLAELGYVRSAKKCKEKFENVHKYYKRTKEGRAGRQDGKSYRFFSQLEALHTTTTTTTTTTTPVPTVVVPVSMGIGTVIATSGRIQPNSETATPNAPPTQIGLPRMNPLDLSGGVQIGVSGSASAAVGLAFSSDTSSDYSDSDDDLEGEPSNTNTRKRKRGESSSNRKMMGFFEGLMKQVIERQEAMQQRFLETIEKREQDRMIREEAWKHQEMARLNREHEIIAHEREISATRDAAIIAFLQKITGQSIQLPPSVAIPPTPPPQSTPPPPPQPQPQQQHYQQQQKKEIIRHQPTTTELVVAAIPEQQHPPQEMGGGGGGGSLDQSSSRWPKAEVLALISLRSGLDSRYQDAGPKGPLWEEISAGMHRMGYNRSSKRCKEKWENINKYFKKVKESNKKRPEDAKTCPYFHQLDDLYRKKMLGGVGSSSFVNQNNEQQQLDSSTNDSNPTANLQAIMAPPPPPPPETNEAENKNIDDNNGGSIEVKKPEDIMMEHHPQHSVMDFYEKLEEPNRDNRDHEEEDEEEVMEDDEEETEEEEEEERKMGYKIQFQRPNAGSSNGGGNTGGSPFMAMVK